MYLIGRITSPWIDEVKVNVRNIEIWPVSGFNRSSWTVLVSKLFNTTIPDSDGSSISSDVVDSKDSSYDSVEETWEAVEEELLLQADKEKRTRKRLSKWKIGRMLTLLNFFFVFLI